MQSSAQIALSQDFAKFDSKIANARASAKFREICLLSEEPTARFSGHRPNGLRAAEHARVAPRFGLHGFAGAPRPTAPVLSHANPRAAGRLPQSWF